MSDETARIVPPVPSTDGEGTSAPRPLAVIPFRWPGHGADVRVLVGLGEARLCALDLAHALELPVETCHDGAGDIVRRSYAPAFDGLGEKIAGPAIAAGFAERWLTASDVEALVARTGHEHGRELMLFAYDLKAQLAGLGIVDLAEAAASSPTVQTIATSFDGTYDMRQASRELTKRLGRTIGRRGLFDRLGSTRIGWIQRDRDGIWAPTERIRRARLLVVKPNHQVPGRGTYPQIRVTELGLDALTDLLADRTEPSLLDDLS